MIDLKKTRIYDGMPLYYIDDYNHLCDATLHGFYFDKDTKKVSYIVKKYKYDVEVVKDDCILGFGGELFTDAEEAIQKKLSLLKSEYKSITSDSYRNNIGDPDENQILLLSKAIEFLESQSPLNKLHKEIKETSEYISNGLKALGYTFDQKKREDLRKFILIIHHAENGKGFWAQPIDFESDIDGNTLDEISESAQELIDVWIENNPDEVPKSINELGIELYKRMTNTDEVVGYLTIIPSIDKKKLYGEIIWK